MEVEDNGIGKPLLLLQTMKANIKNLLPIPPSFFRLSYTYIGNQKKLNNSGNWNFQQAQADTTKNTTSI